MLESPCHVSNCDDFVAFGDADLGTSNFLPEYLGHEWNGEILIDHGEKSNLLACPDSLWASMAASTISLSRNFSVNFAAFPILAFYHHYGFFQSPATASRRTKAARFTCRAVNCANFRSKSDRKAQSLSATDRSTKTHFTCSWADTIPRPALIFQFSAIYPSAPPGSLCSGIHMVSTSY